MLMYVSISEIKTADFNIAVVLFIIITLISNFQVFVYQ